MQGKLCSRSWLIQEKHVIIMLSPFYSVYLRTVSWEYFFFVVCTVVLSNGLVNTYSLFLTQ